MREQLMQYVELLFAGAPDSEDIKQEILQNTLDRYDDLIAQGKVPEAAYRLAIAGIGDINEILGTPQPVPHYTPPQEATQEYDTPAKKSMRAAGIGLYIICAVPLFILSELGMSTLGLCGTLALVAVATMLMVLGKKNSEAPEEKEAVPTTPQQELNKSIRSLINIITLAVYLVLSFATGAWYITWLIFPISAAVKGLVRAIIDLKEAVEHEN